MERGLEVDSPTAFSDSRGGCADIASRAADVHEAHPARPRRHRDLFPLPVPAGGERSFVATDLSRTTKRRLHRTSHRREM
eukprot:3769650-Pyramimonas_sp.AAC.1